MTESAGTSDGADPVRLELSSDQALVLFDWLYQRSSSESPDAEDTPEERVLAYLECLLEASLSAPLSPDYARLLERARANL